MIGKPNPNICTFILQKKYHLKLWKVRPSQWRRRIAFEFIERHLGNANDFIQAWEYLDKEGLLV